MIKYIALLIITIAFASCAFLKKGSNSISEKVQTNTSSLKDSVGTLNVDSSGLTKTITTEFTKTDSGYERQVDEQVIAWILPGDTSIIKTVRRIKERGSKQSLQAGHEFKSDSSAKKLSEEVAVISKAHIEGKGSLTTKNKTVQRSRMPAGVYIVGALLLIVVLFLYLVYRHFK